MIISYYFFEKVPQNLQNISSLSIIRVCFIIYNALTMTKKHEAMKKAKESRKKIIEWWKEAGRGIIDMLLWAIWAWLYTVLSAWEKWISKINEHKKNAKWISASKKKDHRNKAKEHSEIASLHIKEAWRLGKKVYSWTGRVIKWWWEAFWHTLDTGYHLIDAWDKAIGEQIEKKQNKKWKKSWRIWRFARNNIAKLMIVLGITWYWWYKWWKYIEENNQHKEAMLANAENNIIINPEETQITVLEEDENTGETELSKKKKVELDETYKDIWVTLIRDNKLTFYVVKKWDSLIGIKNKLQKIPEFSYLSSKEYEIPETWRNIQSFNTPASSLTPWFYLPIPLKLQDREISEDDFKKVAKDALNEMQTNKVYWEKTKELLKNINESNIIDIMTAYARCETAPDSKTFSDNIWNVELHRREPSCRAYSFSYFHILMWEWPWLNARLRLWLTEWDCYDAKNACKLFLWYCFEKKPWDPTYFFKVKDLWDAKKVGKTYNWSSKYWDKFWANIQHVKWNDSCVS